MIIAVEGIDGSAKTTQVARLVARFRVAGVTAESMAFPDRSTVTGLAIDALLRDEWEPRLTARQREFAVVPRLMAELREREAHLRAVAMQALQTVNRYEVIERLRMFAKYQYRPPAGSTENSRYGDALVLDRYWLSGLVYGASDGLDARWLEDVHRALPQPDLWLLIDGPVRARGDEPDAYERDIEKQEDVRRRYLAEFEEQRGREIVDGVGTIDEVAERVWAACAGVREELSIP